MLSVVRSFVELTSGRNRHRLADGYLLSPERFDLAASAERMRVDRNQSVISLLVIEPSATRNSPRDIQDLERLLAARLRLTDTAGWMRDGRLGVLLPDTPESGAWKVAEDICDQYPVGEGRPNCEVVTYPDRDRTEGNPAGDTVPPDLVGAAQSLEGGAGDALSRYDAYFLRPTPAWKRSLDIAGAAVGLLVAAPVIALAAAAVKLSSEGPAFFIQEREGYAGRRFRIYKLRTMRPDAEKLKASLRLMSEQDGPAFKMVDDPRITPIGRVLRKTSLDELPQLWNVLRGDMSLVGPRPLPVDESRACKPWQRRRLHVKPGLTCTWQIHGRNVVLFDDWIRMDLDYADRRSPWLDLVLVAKTGPCVLLRKGR
ncbi:sugar transferase [Botrimarina mediterranea]|uniref:Putative sugar transferase EpsL n=1 Tax=Botrimarina mediterranea TaxID=2528022 RepID=A0A518K6G2_9BACT|nr:sugar transferase [Botrimarina mediterranea]QDV73370.1 putative sugar transferase EpsL [Botrimarina mediterranea]